MLSNLSIRFVMTTTDLSKRVCQFKVLLIDIESNPEQQLEKYSEVHLISGQPEGHGSHLFHTSGSTGKPKAVQISSRALNNPGFDLSLFEIWYTLLSGGTVVHIPKPIIKDPVSFAAFLKDASIAALILPATLFTAVSASAPSAFQNIRHVVSAGESPSPQAMQSVLSSGAPENLWNGYGPTETTCLSNLQRVTLEETQNEHISAGVPF
ncbi:unnamed protein product [Penicillium salamii]|nr:unnamed protein product [Penicillium salamii]CAG8353329.1 unnamed protein product [Penicillium salamii]